MALGNWRGGIKMADQDVFPASAKNEFIMAQFLHEKTNQDVHTKGKNMSKVNNRTLKELKDAIELTNENITEMRKTIKENHQEVMTKIKQVEKKQKQLSNQPKRMKQKLTT